MFRHEKVFAMERNCIVSQKIHNAKFLSFYIRNFVTSIVESVRTPARITPYPTGRLFWVAPVPGTSCQATIVPSLRDISQQALARCCCEMSASASRRDNTDRSLARSTKCLGNRPPKIRPVRVRYDRAQLNTATGDGNRFAFLSDRPH